MGAKPYRLGLFIRPPSDLADLPKPAAAASARPFTFVTGDTRAAVGLAFAPFYFAVHTIAPGTIRADATTAFTQYFQSWQTGRNVLFGARWFRSPAIRHRFETALTRSAVARTAERTQF